MGLGLYGLRAFLVPCLADHCTVTSLDLRSNALGDEGVRVLAAALATHSLALRELNVCDNGVTNQGVPPITRLVGCARNLRVLDLSFNAIGSGREAAAFFGAVRSSKLERLRLEACGLSDAVQEVIASACASAPLRELRMCTNQFVRVTPILKALHTRRTIEVLHVHQNNFEDVKECARALAAILVDPTCSLAHVNVPAHVMLSPEDVHDSYSLLSYRGGQTRQPGETIDAVLRRNYEQRFAMQTWSTLTHVKFSAPIREAVHTIFLVHRYSHSAFALLPFEVVEMIIPLIPYLALSEGNVDPEQNSIASSNCAIL
eukprot:TRINITY_DN1600_c0_g1_i1.p1 TRINITY_DN1600_c0_g1~~TRINITY_DN1600_c0_g1_i1.p1  ORF type:complete len:354 (-),score=69.60 TRINITY_DN1600_c0_g1_i1:112-1059(-)